MDVPESTFKVLDYAWGVITVLIGVAWKSNEAKMSTMRKHLDEKIAYHGKRLDDIETDTDHELTTQRGHIDKIFDKLEDNSRRAEDRHIELLKAIHTGLAGKQDK